jgi:crossover junction endodeoxyribonuclease RuvC
MRVLGIDPGTARIGWGVIDIAKPGRLDTAVMVDYGCITTPAGMPAGDRLRILAQDLDGIVAEYKPSLVGLERLFFMKNQTTAMAVAEARGVILYILAGYDAKLVEVTPQVAKQTVTGYGRAEKKQMQRMVTMQLKLDEIPQPDDAADALAIALTVAVLGGMENKLAGK